CAPLPFRRRCRHGARGECGSARGPGREHVDRRLGRPRLAAAALRGVRPGGRAGGAGGPGAAGLSTLRRGPRPGPRADRPSGRAGCGARRLRPGGPGPRPAGVRGRGRPGCCGRRGRGPAAGARAGEPRGGRPGGLSAEARAHGRLLTRAEGGGATAAPPRAPRARKPAWAGKARGGLAACREAGPALGPRRGPGGGSSFRLVVRPRKKLVAKGGKKKKQVLKFTLDCTHPVEDGIMDAANFEQFLQDRIKVNGKAGNLGGGAVTIERSKNKITVTSEVPFSKRYLKYLTKKYLKKNNLRDWLRVVANSKESYELRYFQINQDEEEEEDED
ncbi:60S ribosomal protein L22, partial [Galemys pyrenaicus]